jgi:HEAT repeat protein
MIDNLDDLCRSIAVAGHRGDWATVEPALTRPELRIRVVAIGAANRLGRLDPAQIEGFLADPAPEVRYRALEVLPSIADAADAVDTVITALDDQHLSEIAAFTLGELPIDEEQLPRVAAALENQARNHSDALCRESAVAALGSLGIGLPSILRACDDVATVRRRAVLALAPFDGPEVEAALHRALDDRDWQVRQAAEDLLGP